MVYKQDDIQTKQDHRDCPKREKDNRTGAGETDQGSQVAYGQAESSAHAGTQQNETDKHNGQQHVSA